MIEGFLFYWVESDTGGLAVDEAIKNAVDILPDAARALAAGRYHALVRAQVTMGPFAVDLFVIESFFHLKKVLSSFMN